MENKPNNPIVEQMLKLAEVADVLTKKQAKELVDFLVNLTNEQKKQMVSEFNTFADNVSQETHQKIVEALQVVSEKHSDALLEVRQLTNKQKKSHENALAELQNLLAEIKAVEVKDGIDGKDADETKIIEEVLSKIPKQSEYELLGENVVDSINTLNTEPEYQIDAKHIKNLPITNVGGSNISKAICQLSDVSLSNLSNNDTLKYNSTTKLWENGTGGGGAVSSVNGQTGAVVLGIDDILATNQVLTTTRSMNVGIDSFTIVSNTFTDGLFKVDDFSGFVGLGDFLGTLNGTSITVDDQNELVSITGRTLINLTGSVAFGSYGSGLITGTPTYGAAFDAGGNVIEVALGGSPGGSNKQFQWNNSSAFTGSSNLTQETNKILVTATSTSVVPFVVQSTSSSQTSKLFEVLRYDADPGFSVAYNTEVTLGGAYDYVNAKHALQHIVRYAGGGGYSGKGLKLQNLDSGSIVRLHSFNHGLYLTDDGGTAAAMTLGTRTNPGDASNFIASAGRWIIDAGGFVVNNALWTGYAQSEIYSTTLPQLGLMYNTSNYFKTTVGSTGGVTFDAVGSGSSFTFSDAIINTVPLRLKGYTVATLPAGTVGDICYVTDQLTAANAKGVAPTGGGTITCVQVYNGAAWVGI